MERTTPIMGGSIRLQLPDKGITPQIYLFLLDYANFSQKKNKIFAHFKKKQYLCSTKSQDIHNKDFIPMCKHSRGERANELLFFFRSTQEIFLFGVSGG